MISPIDQRRRNRFREGAALLLLAITALLLQRSATTYWAQTSAADATRYEVSPIGLARFPTGAAPPGAGYCRWWPRVGNLELCALAPDGGAAFVWLRRAYPLTVIALWTSVLALFLNALRVPRQAPSVRIVAAAAVPALSVAALGSLVSTSNSALAVLKDLEIRPLNPGFALVVTATALSTAAAILLISSSEPKTDHMERGVS